MNIGNINPMPIPAPKNFLTSWPALILVFIIFVCLVIYYKTIGYYFDFGWKQIYTMMAGKERVDIDIGDAGLVKASVQPMPLNELPVGMPGAQNGPSVASSLMSSMESIVEPDKEVYNVSRNIYTFNDASAVCDALNGKLATYEQVKKAHEDGADWCNYGWVKGQMAVFPTQTATWEKLQKGSPDFRNACGRPGVNGGYFDNPELRFGVNCYGVRPPKSATDELEESQVALPQSPDEIEYNKKVQTFRDQLNTITVLPFRRGQWSD